MRILVKCLMSLGALGAALVPALSVGAPPEDPSAQRGKLTLWAGHWKRHGEVKETQFGHARLFDYDVKCAVLPFGAYVVCNSLSARPDPNDGGRISNEINAYYYSDVDKTFKCTHLNMEGGPRENVVQVDGNVWTEPLQIPKRSGGMADARFVYTFVSADKKLARFEISLDKGATWIVVDEFVDTRQS
jgi:hypothetical protein